MEIRFFTDHDDKMAVSHVYEESWKSAYKNIIPASYLESIPKGQWVNNLEKTGMHHLLLLENDQIIGCACICKSRFVQFPEWGEIVSIYLLPQYMGRGFGKALFTSALEQLKKMGYMDAFLWVLEENTNAIGFYEKMGFTRGKEVLEDSIGGKDLIEVAFYKHHEI